MAPISVVSVPGRRTLGLAISTAVITGGLAVAGSRLLDVPLRDPDGFLGPSWVRIPLILLFCLVLDVVPRTLWRARGLSRLLPVGKEIWRERWPAARLIPVVVAVASFYVTYVAYRNLKNFLPFVHEGDDDMALAEIDHLLTFGHNPAGILHAVLGTGAAAHVLSDVYMAFLIFVPISVVVSLIWSRHLSHGLWYVTALCVNWALGAASYYLVPSSGPFWALPWDFDSLPHTRATGLQQSLLNNRTRVLADPNATSSVSGIAAFASLHVAVIFTAALIVHLTARRRLARVVMWTYFALTATSTIYFGWHYLSDDIAGLAIGGSAVWMGAWATGHLKGSEPSDAVAAVPHTPDTAAATQVSASR